MWRAPRDLDAIRLIASHRFLTRPQLEELLLSAATLTPRSRHVLAWRVLGRLQRDGYVAVTPRQIGGATGGSSLPAYFLTATGLRVAATMLSDLPNRRPARRAAFLAPHSIVTTEIELAFRRAARADRSHEVMIWEADWQIAMRYADRWVVPDARLTYRTGDWLQHFFLEADLGTEGTRFFARKMRRYVELYDSGVWRDFMRSWARILTVTLTDGRASSLRRATEAMLESKYPYLGTRLNFYFLSLDALRSGGVRALCYAAHKAERQPLLDLDAIAAKSAASAATDHTDARNLGDGRSDASGRRNEGTPRATTEVGGLA